jgi:S-(hydroxymethyl)glutathione dehydrogenase/alcohol dehydrogenase
MPGRLSGLAAVTDGTGGYALRLVDSGPPAAGEVRVRIAAAGLCHTDLASLRWPGPLVMGHEGAGYVEAIGPDVVGFDVGTAVLLNWAIPCHACPQCAAGHAALCDRTLETDPALFGTSRSHPGASLIDGEEIRRSFNLGTFAEHAVVRTEALVRLPDWLEPGQACVLGCAVMTGVGSVLNVARVGAGEKVGVVGCGSVGLSIIQGARIAGAAMIVAIDRDRARLEKARAMGASDTLLAEEGDGSHAALVEAVRDLTGRRGLDHAFEATGRPELAFVPLKLIRNGGTALQVSGSHGQVSATMPDFFWNKRYITSLYGDCVPERDFPRLFDWVRRGAIDLPALISREYALTDLESALEDLRAGRIAKGVIRIGA